LLLIFDGNVSLMEHICKGCQWGDQGLDEWKTVNKGRLRYFFKDPLQKSWQIATLRRNQLRIMAGLLT